MWTNRNQYYMLFDADIKNDKDVTMKKMGDNNSLPTKLIDNPILRIHLD